MITAKIDAVYVPTYQDITPEDMIDQLLTDWEKPWAGREIQKIGVEEFVQQTVFPEYLTGHFAFRKPITSPGRNWVKLTHEAFSKALREAWDGVNFL